MPDTQENPYNGKRACAVTTLNLEILQWFHLSAVSKTFRRVMVLSVLCL